MIIWGFGDSEGTAYEFPTTQAEDDLVIRRPEVVLPVGGAGGVFDFLGDDPYPVAPFLVRKTFTLSGDDYDDVEVELEDLKAATILKGRSRLFGKRRGYPLGPHRWAWAKCTHVDVGERRKQYVHFPVTLEFICQEGVWYTTEDGTLRETNGSFTLSNYGTYPALVRTTIQASGGAITQVTLTNNTNGYTWTFSGAIASGDVAIVNAQTYECTNDGADAYDDLSYGSTQVSWMVLDPGDNSMNLQVTGASFSVDLYRYRTFL